DRPGRSDLRHDHRVGLGARASSKTGRDRLDKGSFEYGFLALGTGRFEFREVHERGSFLREATTASLQPVDRASCPIRQEDVSNFFVNTMSLDDPLLNH